MTSPSFLFQKASKIDENIIEEIFVSDEMIQLEIESPSGSNNLVTIDENGMWNCTCENYFFTKNKFPGEYCCKHILAAINYIFNKKE